MATATAVPTVNGPAEGKKVSLTRTIRAPRARVFRAWTDPATVTKWFGPDGMSCIRAEVDLSIGGPYLIEVKQDADPSKGSVATGEYRQIVPNELLQFTWEGSWRPGEISLVTVTFRDAAQPGSTELTILHDRITADDALAGYEKGWLGCMTKLAALLAA